ncbi:hypothetical protein KIW84_014046 [Lathyrus oleraceus]|uniref:Uncharacterized protein n=1 Tax=Pisum sativum TaxID=3888 RepID=A0A9D5BMA7_PEA|nr:hypothetical protein KIW84_014046 [Pisum sativum]
MHAVDKEKVVVGSSKKVLQISRKNDKTKEAVELEKSMPTESNIWEDSSRSDVSDTKIQENIRIRERVIAALNSPNLDIRINPSDDGENSENEEEYSWESVVSLGYKVEKNVIHFPKYVTKDYFWWNQKAIEIIDYDNIDRYYGEVHCAKRKNKAVKLEKFIGKGWYEYAKKKRLRRGGKVGFTIRSPPYLLFVYILNHGRKVV